MNFWDSKILYQRLREAKRQLEIVKDDEEKISLANYILSLQEAISRMEKKRPKKNFDKETCNYLGEKNKQYENKLYESFVLDKDFHKEYLGQIIDNIEDDYLSFYNVKFCSKEKEFSKKDFWDILFLFLKEIHMEELFTHFYEEGDIHFLPKHLNAGFTVYNPLSKQLDLFVEDFHYDIYSMQTLVHECAHAYDYTKLLEGAKEYNDYLYFSFYGETLSLLFERLYLRFLLKNNIRVGEAKDELIYFEEFNYKTLTGSYIWSLLDADFILSGKVLQTKNFVILKNIKNYFADGSTLRMAVKNLKEFSLFDIYNYCYGDIISLFLCEEVTKYGFSKEIMQNFMENRNTLFSKDFLKENDLEPKKYAKLYQKEVNLLKKY